MSIAADNRKVAFLAAATATVGGASAWLLATVGHPWVGALLAVAGTAGAVVWAFRGPIARPVGSLAELLEAVERDPGHPQAPLAAEVKRLLELVQASGKSIRDVVRQLQEHATLVAWVIDSLNHAVSGARANLASMQEAVRRVASHADEVLNASLRGSEFMEAMGGRTEDLFRSAETLNTAVGAATASMQQIHSNLYGVQQGVALLSEASDRTTQFISQVGGAMGTIRERTGQSLAVTEKMEEHARRGRDTVVRLGDGVAEIRRASEGMVGSVHALGEQSKEIEGVLAIITDVAEETSLLSLNAAILAAQAGESGAAFAVVAEQIRSLAHRTRQSTKHIEELVRGIQSNITEANRGLGRSLEAVEDGSQMGQEAVRQLELIESAVVDSVDQVRQIAEAAREQDEKAHAMVDAAGEVNQNLHQVARALGLSISEMGRIQDAIQSLSTLSESVRGASEEHRQTGRNTRDLMSSLSTQVEGIQTLVGDQNRTGKGLEQALGTVSESSDNTRDSLKSIHTIVADLVGESDRLQQEVQILFRGTRGVERG
jgi:methyl-accepting chemotaxis protein